MMSVRALVRSARVPQHARVPLTRAVSAGPGSSWTWHEDGTNILRAIVEWGPGLTWRKLLHMKEIRFGNLVGVDKYGNHYYENLSYGYGRHRWVEHAGLPRWSFVEPTRVTSDWHGWLHYMTDVTGDNYMLQKGGENNFGSDSPYDTNLGGVVADFTENLTNRRNRNYGAAAASDSAPFNTSTDMYWKQPSHPTAPGGPIPFESKVEEWVPPGAPARRARDPKSDATPSRDLNLE